ncbi:MAG: PAS domain-containing protein [Actinobacteria bacterium]|nr:PAS domain-containing protein [Actinomycetota bacterium]
MASRPGDVQVRVTGVRDGAHLDGLITAMRAVRGVSGVTLRAYETVHEPLLLLRTTRPVSIASELRAGLGPQVTSCVVTDGRIELELDGHADRPASRGPLPRDYVAAGTAPRVAAARGTEGRDMPPPLIDAWRATTGASPTAPPSPGGLPGRRTRGAPGAWARRPVDAPGPVPGDGGPPADHDGGPGAPAPADAHPEDVRPDPTRPDGPGRGPSPGPTGPATDGTLLDAIDAVEAFCVLTFGTDLRFVRTAGALHDRYGPGRDALVGRHPREVLGEAGWALLGTAYEGTLEGRTAVRETPSPDGERHYEATFRPVHDGDRIVGGTVTLVDVTAERRDERRLAELRDVLASAFDRSPVGQALVAADGRWMRVNEALRRLVDRSDESLVGTDLEDLTHPDDREREARLLQAVGRGDQDGYDVEKRVVRGDGVTIVVHARMTAIRAHDGRLRGFIAHLDDAGHWHRSGR